MYSSKYANKSGNAVSECYYSDGQSKPDVKTEEKVNKANKLTKTIFDMPEFVVDAYLDAVNCESSEHAGFRILSEKYNHAEGNYNCNHGSDGACSQDKPKAKCSEDPACGFCPPQPKENSGCAFCPPEQKQTTGGCCSDGSPYEKGATPYEEEKKQCGCTDGSPYEVGENAFVEPLKVPRCGCDSNPYEEGAFPFKNDYTPPKVNTKAKDTTKEKAPLPDISVRYPLECNSSVMGATVDEDSSYEGGENCAVCISKSNN